VREIRARVDLTPSQRYYKLVQGRWRAPFSLVLTDRERFEATRMSALDRARVRSMLLLGPFAFDTSVDYDSGVERGEVVHTTRVSKLGMTLLSGFERIALDPDGRTARFVAEHRLSPTPWRIHRFEGRIEVDESGTRASYFYPWCGSEMRQTTVATAELVTITQETDWSRAILELRPAAA
jgi:hypothetical protein